MINYQLQIIKKLIERKRGEIELSTTTWLSDDEIYALEYVINNFNTINKTLQNKSLLINNLNKKIQKIANQKEIYKNNLLRINMTNERLEINNDYLLNLNKHLEKKLKLKSKSEKK